MISLLYLVAFPGLVLIAGVRWWRAAGAYRRSIERPASDDGILDQRPEAESQGMLSWIEKRTATDRRIRRGEFGDEALRALEHERRAFTVFVVSGPVAILIVALLRMVLPRTTISGSDAVALVTAAFAIGILLIALLITARIATGVR
jgi:hypothetical protein